LYYANKNGANIDPSKWKKCNSGQPTNCWVYPYVDKSGVTHDDQVEVRLRAHVVTFIAGVIGIYGADVSARAVAGAIGQVGPPSTSTSIRTGTTDPGDTSTIVSTITVGVPGNGNGVAFAKSTA